MYLVGIHFVRFDLCCLIAMVSTSYCWQCGGGLNELKVLIIWAQYPVFHHRSREIMFSFVEATAV